MNFLAHQYLSGADHEIKIGNFIADMIRGKEMEGYEAGIQQGIKLHRAIDQFTDHHEVVKEAITIFKASQGKYAPVIVDIAFDHFLAANWKRYHAQELGDFAQDFYSILSQNEVILPQKVQQMLPFMKAQNWLYEYQYLDGIQKAFEGMSRRASFDSNMANARLGLEKHYEELQGHFDVFFEDMISFVKEQNIDL
jgi:acyl carrier protein phosphodiesterase